MWLVAPKQELEPGARFGGCPKPTARVHGDVAKVGEFDDRFTHGMPMHAGSPRVRADGDDPIAEPLTFPKELGREAGTAHAGLPFDQRRDERVGGATAHAVEATKLILAAT